MAPLQKRGSFPLGKHWNLVDMVIYQYTHLNLPIYLSFLPIYNIQISVVRGPI